MCGGALGPSFCTATFPLPVPCLQPFTTDWGSKGSFSEHVIQDKDLQAFLWVAGGGYNGV